MFFAPLEQFEIVFSNLDGCLEGLFLAPSAVTYLNALVFFYSSLLESASFSDWSFAVFRPFILAFFFFVLIFGRSLNGFIWPRFWQLFMELLYSFMATTFREQVGYRGQRYFPFFATTFLFVLLLNIFGMIPYEGAITSQLVFNLSMSFMLLFVLTIIGFLRQGKGFLKLFLPPPGVPKALFPLIIFIEIISYVARGVSLGVRLFANIMAGHTLLFIFSSFILQVNFLVGLGIFVVIFLVTFLEFFIAALQAYVFYVLVIIYFRDSIEVSHYKNQCFN